MKQAADAAQRHRNTIHKALEAGELHGSQRIAGGKWSIRESCLEAWLDGAQCDHMRPVRLHAR